MSRLPKKRLLLSDKSLSFPKRHAPSDNCAELLVRVAAQSQVRPVTRGTAGVFNRSLEHVTPRHFAVGDTAQLHTRQNWFPNRFPVLPLNVETNGRAAFRMLPQCDLVHIPLV